jgi:hypothetical protein
MDGLLITLESRILVLIGNWTEGQVAMTVSSGQPRHRNNHLLNPWWLAKPSFRLSDIMELNRKLYSAFGTIVFIKSQAYGYSLHKVKWAGHSSCHLEWVFFIYRGS